MGKRYYCDYCDKTMAAAPSIVKTHNRGLVHQKLVLEHYQKHKDPETILAEESRKKPCSRFPNNQCQFGAICRFSHYTRDQIDQLREIVAAKERTNNNTVQPAFEYLYHQLQEEKTKSKNNDGENTVLYDSSGITHVFPWTYNPTMTLYGDTLPPSIKMLKIEDFESADITTWG
ncbi:zinc finger matrin-type protein 5 [Pectinophora gossypiella]|uniref:zinc finger matrin-type protein 5 n=1 Tax=Pectinophora gossypiella TaxID=13191 RepID=UPI00214F2E45|nr:zinc finger matrin-type protein 5 [Pectinophora gossypiella]XP_049882380.1 zinc finger matrin-type protein 5 [Pectinophora gossypiella]